MFNLSRLKMKNSSRAKGGVNFSYYSGERSSKGQATQHTRQNLKGVGHFIKQTVIRLVVLGILVVISYFGLTLSGKVKVIPSSTAYHSSSDYQQAIQKLADSLKNRSKLTFDDKNLSKNIQSLYPEVQNVNIELPLVSRQPLIRLDVSQPAAVLLGRRGDRYLVAADGKIVGIANDKFSNLLILQDDSALTVTSGYQLFSTDQISFIQDINTQLNNAGLKIGKVIIPAIAQELDIQLSKDNYYIKFLLNGNPNLQVGSYLATRHYLLTHHLHPSSYVDVRVSGKVFYK